MNTRVKYPSKEWKLPPGRFIRGSFLTMTTTDHKRQPLPENKHHYWIAMAVAKSDPAIGGIINEIVAHVWGSYQTVAGNAAVMQQINMLWNATAFAWRISDGDTDAGWKDRPGAAGCWVFELRTNFDLNTFDASNAVVDPKVFQYGDWMDAYISIAINGEVGNTAGVFLNPMGLRYLGQGDRITIGRDAASMFGAPAGGAYQHAAPRAPAMSHQVQGQAAPQIGGPGQAGPAPGAPQPPAPPPPPPAPAAAAEPAQAQAARLGIQYHPGYRLDEATRQYVPDVSPNGYASAPAAPAPAPQPPAVPSAAAGGYPATAAPSSGPYGLNNPPPVAPMSGFTGGPPRV